MNKEYLVSVTCSFTTPVKADSLEEAIEKTKKLYKYGRGRLPREYIEVSDACNGYVYQVED